MNDDILNVFKEEDDFHERYRPKREITPAKSGGSINHSLKSNTFKSRNSPKSKNDLANEMVPLFDDQKIENKLLEEQKRQKEETAKKNKQFFDQESNNQVTNEKGKLPSYPIDSMG